MNTIQLYTMHVFKGLCVCRAHDVSPALH